MVVLVPRSAWNSCGLSVSSDNAGTGREDSMTIPRPRRRGPAVAAFPSRARRAAGAGRRGAAASRRRRPRHSWWRRSLILFSRAWRGVRNNAAAVAAVATALAALTSAVVATATLNSTQRQIEIAEQGQVTDRYIRAVASLAVPLRTSTSGASTPSNASPAIHRATSPQSSRCSLPTSGTTRPDRTARH